MINTPDPSKRALILRLLERFIQTESSGGVIMIIFAALAMIAANSALAGWYGAFVDAPITLGSITEPVNGWVKDVLMVLFFLTVGMELKREMAEGLLAQKGQVFMPLLAAIGGMAVPALLFYALNHSNPETVKGWAIPSATDIAFALCILMMFGKSVPASAKILLLAIAIFDDLGAIIIIALFYNTKIAVVPLLFTAGGAGLLALLNRCKISAITPYILTGIYLWFCLHEAGIHTTIAGVAVGMAIPMRDRKHSSNSPLNKCMHFLHPWVSFGVLPIFAFVSAGVNFADMHLSELFEPLPLGIALGLFVGKQIGIFGMIFLLVKAGLAKLPEGTGFGHVYAVSIIAGIGFTMSLFISLLAFPGHHLQEVAKIGVIAGSLLSTLYGGLVLFCVSKR
nr:Na+/H+ antiporter [uncultured bacterium]